MNKRLNRLIDQAGFIKFTVEEDPETPIDWSCDYTEELNKFAELIIRKCAKVADLADENKCEWIGGNILTHFGVSE
jgi:hypothetical protein